MYWLYCTIAIWTFRKLAGKQFFNRIAKVCKINIILQVIIYCFGSGRYYHEGWGGGRFMGTFNDPNQCAFLSLPCFFFYLYANAIAGDSSLAFFSSIYFGNLCDKVNWNVFGSFYFWLIICNAKDCFEI